MNRYIPPKVRNLKIYSVYSAVEHSDYYSPCDIPEKMLSKVGGQVIMSECQPYVCFP